MPSGSRPVRFFRLTALSLVAGLAATIATAWGLALWKEVSWEHGARTRGARALDPAAGEGTGWLTVERFSGTGAAFFETNVLTGGGGSFSTAIGPPRGPDPLPEEVVPAWIRPSVIPWAASGSWPPASPVNHVLLDTRGWPMLALSCTYEIERPVSGGLHAKAHGAITLPGKIVPKGSWFGGGYPPSLPLRPRWTGLLVNALFFGTLLAVPILAHGAGRRALRRRRGRCPRCGYDLSGTPAATGCPECGAPGTLT